MADNAVVESNEIAEAEVKSNGDVSYQEEPSNATGEDNANVEVEAEKTEVQQEEAAETADNTGEAKEENQEEKVEQAVDPTPVEAAHNEADSERNFADPSLPFRVTGIDQEVRLRMGDDKPRNYKPQTIFRWLHSIVQKHPKAIALGVHRDNMWQKWTYEEYYRDIRAAAKSFVHLGLQKYNAVAIFGFNSPEWYMSNFGSIFAGGVSLGIYTTSSPEAIKYILEDSNTAIAVVENTASLKRVLKAAEGSLRIKAIIQYTGEIEEQQPNIYTWKDFIKLGKDMSDEELDSRTADITPNKCCSLIYTSGTTGNPKGAMLSHDNLVWTAHVTWDRLYSELPPTGPERFVSYLPLSHIAAQLVEVYMPTTVHGSVYFARPDALKGTLVDTLKDVRPTFMMGVPRVWEKIAEKLQALARQNHGLKKKIGNWAKGVGLRGNLSVNEGGSVPFGWGIAKALVFKKIKVGLGLDKCKRRYVGAAPISKDAMKYYMSIDLSLQEVFGLTESSGPFTLSPVGGIKLGSCGIAIGGLDSKIDQPDEDGVGELCGFGRNVFMGYLNNEAKTNEAIDENGWLHTGDLAKQDKNGYVYITGRQKEIIITSGGENVAPVPIEEDIKKELPMLSSVMLVGDQRKYLTCLVAFKVEVDPNTTAPTNKLTPEAVEICHKLGVEVRTVEEVIEDKTDTIKKAIQAGLDRVNERSKSRAQKVQKAHIIEKDFSVPGGELGPTLKLKRPVVLKLYADVIDKVYAEE